MTKRRKAALLADAAMLLVLLLFFMPWLSVAKDLAAVAPWREMLAEHRLAEELADICVESGLASGMHLSLGKMSDWVDVDGLDLSVNEKLIVKNFFRERDVERNRTIKARPWFLLGLVLPLAGLVIDMRWPGSQREGKALMELGAAGIILLALAATTVHYIKVGATRTEPCLWVSMFLYATVMVCGLSLVYRSDSDRRETAADE